MKTTEEKLDKTLRSIHNHISRGGTNRSQRGYALVDRYEDLRAQAIEEDVWGHWCYSHSFDTNHDAYDCFA